MYRLPSLVDSISRDGKVHLMNGNDDDIISYSGEIWYGISATLF